MEIYNISSISDLHEALSRYKYDTRWLFRGHADVTWKLAPKAGRPEFSHYSDQKSFKQWERGASHYLDLSKSSTLEKLAIAQHHGLPTRLLDWTHNPLIAAFFSVIESKPTDAAIYALRIKNKLSRRTQNPFKLGEGTIHYYQPFLSSERLVRQLGHFTVHSPPTLELTDEAFPDMIIEKIVVNQACRNEFVFDLHLYGINSMTVFPDLEGLSKHLLWWVENSHFWKNGNRA